MNWPWRKKKRPDWEVVLYTRAGCCLCDDAHHILRTARVERDFQLRVLDVDADPVLAAEHGPCVPVVTVNGKVRFRGRVNPALLQRLLDAGEG